MPIKIYIKKFSVKLKIKKIIKYLKAADSNPPMEKGPEERVAFRAPG
jgi:hypothetical protein